MLQQLEISIHFDLNRLIMKEKNISKTVIHLIILYIKNVNK